MSSHTSKSQPTSARSDMERAKWVPSVADLEKEIERLRGEREAMKAAHREALRKEIDQRERSLKKMSRELFSGEDTIKSLEDHVKQQQVGELQRKDREIAYLRRQLGDVTSPGSSRPGTPKKSDTVQISDSELMNKSPRETELLVKNSELSFYAKNLRDDNDKLKKEYSLLQNKLEAATKELYSLKKRAAGYDTRITNLTGTVHSKEKQIKRLTDELAEVKAGRQQQALTREQPKSPDRSIIVELQKTQRQLQAKCKELSVLGGEIDKLKKEKEKLGEENKKLTREKVEKRSNELRLQLPKQPAATRGTPATRKLEEDKHKLEKELEDLNLELRRVNGRNKTRVNDLESSLKRRDRQMKKLNDENLKLKAANQMLEEKIGQHKQANVDAVARSSVELDHASAKINKLTQENTRLQEYINSSCSSPVSLSIASGSPPAAAAAGTTPNTSHDRPFSPTAMMLSSPGRSTTPGRSFSPTSLDRPFSPQQLDEFGSMWSLASNESVLQETVEQLKFDHDELYIKYNEMKSEYVNVKHRYTKLRGQYKDLLVKSRNLQATFKKENTERLELEKECARLQQVCGGEFDVDREAHLREQLTAMSGKVSGLEQALSEQASEMASLQEQIELSKSKEADAISAIGKLETAVAERDKELMTQHETVLSLQKEIEQHQQQLFNGSPHSNTLRSTAVAPHESTSLTTTRAHDSTTPSAHTLHDSSSSTEVISHDSSSPTTSATPSHTNSSTVDIPHDQTSSTAVTPRDASSPNTFTLHDVSSQTDVTPHDTWSPTAVTLHDASSQTDVTLHDTWSPTAVTSHNASSQTDVTPHDTWSPTAVTLHDASSQTDATLHDTLSPTAVTLHDASSQTDVRSSQYPAVFSASIQDVAERLRTELKYHSTTGDDRVNSLISELQSLLQQVCGDTSSIATQGVESVDSDEPMAGITGDRFQHWLSQYEAERNALKSQVHDLQERLGVGSQRVMELQGLVGELEGRLATEHSHSISSSFGATQLTHSPTLSTHTEDRMTQTHNTQQPMEYHSSTLAHSVPLAVGSRLKQGLQQTRQGVLHRSWPRVEDGLSVLETSLAELLPDLSLTNTRLFTSSTTTTTTDPTTSSPILRPASPQLSLISSEELSSVEQHDDNLLHSEGVTTLTSTAPLYHHVPQYKPVHEISRSSTDEHIPHIKPALSNEPVTSHHALSPVDTSATKPPAPTDGDKVRLFIALFDYDPQSLCSTGHPERELTLHTGDVIAVYGDMNSDGYCTAVFEGRQGLVPYNFIEEMDITAEAVEQRLLNQSLSSAPCGTSIVSSETEISLDYEQHQAVTNDVEETLAAVPQQGSPDPPTLFHVERAVIPTSLLLCWEPPYTDLQGRSNGCLVSGYTIQCDNVTVIEHTQPLETKVLVEVSGLDHPHTLTIFTTSEEGLTSDTVSTEYPGSSVVQAQYDYNPRTLSPNPTPELELSFKEGEVITVYGDKMEDGFFLGQLGDKTGFVPSNFVTGLPSGDKNSTGQRGYRRQLFSTAAEHMI